MPHPDDRGNDLVQIMHRIYRELLLDASAARNTNMSSTTWQVRWVYIDQFEKGIQHGMMLVAAGFITRVIKKCAGNKRIGWSIIAHVHECEELRIEKNLAETFGQQGMPRHAHVCGFYAVKLEENGPTLSRKLTFPCVSATDADWIMNLAVDIYDLFTEAKADFVWGRTA